MVSNSYFLPGTKSVTSSFSKQRTRQHNSPNALSGFWLMEVGERRLERGRIQSSKGCGEKKSQTGDRRVPELTKYSSGNPSSECPSLSSHNIRSLSRALLTVVFHTCDASAGQPHSDVEVAVCLSFADQVYQRQTGRQLAASPR